MTVFKAAIIGLVTLGIILCLVLALAKAVRACAAQRPDGGRRKAVAAGLGVAKRLAGKFFKRKKAGRAEV